METKNILEVENLVIDLNDILTGKFFDLKRRLEKFLASLTECEDVLDFLADCLVGFNEEDAMAKTFSFDRKSGMTKISLPSDDKERLALSITIFDNIASDKMNANQLLETFFQDGKMTPIQNFLDKIVRPFRDAICKHFEIASDISVMDVKKHEQELKQLEKQEELEPETEQEELPHQGELFEEIKKNCQQILGLLSFEKKRDDFLDDVEFVTNAIMKACENGDLMTVNALVIGLNYISKKFKNARHIVEEMKSLILDYYDFLAQPAENADLAEEDFGGEDG